MSKFCTKCGHELLDGAKFCVKCGNEIFQEQPKKKRNKEIIKKVLIIAVVIYIIICIFGVIAAINDSINSINKIREEAFNNTVGAIGKNTENFWAVEAACKEVKSDIYKRYGDIPNVSGELIYQDGQYYVVTVKYEIPNWQWKSSCACLIYGYGEDNWFLYGMTNEMSYDYNYEENLDDLKALWKLD